MTETTLNNCLIPLRGIVGQKLDDCGEIKMHHRDIGLESYPEVSLAEARDKACELKKQIRDGIDPLQEKQECLDVLRIKQQREKHLKNVLKLFLQIKLVN